MRLAIYNNGSMIITKPYGLPNILVNYFIKSNASKIIQRINSLKKKTEAKDNRHYIKYKDQARNIIENKANEVCRFYRLKYNRLSIRNQKTRWGSCSAKANLNFNYKIMFLPDNLVDYVVTHEICHLKELNHSPDFWKLVGDRISNYKALRREIRALNIKNLS